MQAIVRVEEHEETPACGVHPRVASRGDSAILLAHEPDVRPRREDPCKVVRRTVVDDDDLEILVALRGNAAHRVCEKRGVRVAGNNHGDEMHTGAAHGFTQSRDRGQRVDSTAEPIALGAALAQRPGYGGHAWVVLQYLLGLQRLGCDVTFVDRAEGGDPAWVERVLARRVPYRLLDEAAPAIREASFLDVMGFVGGEGFPGAKQCVFLDIDPGFGQMWRELGQADVFAGHDAFVTIGENINEPWCEIPTCGRDWTTTRQPVVLDEWPATPKEREVFTTVASWRGPWDAVEYEGKRYGLRCHEFRKFFELPRLTGQEFELALDIDPADENDRRALEENGWRLVDPRAVAGDPWSYRRYIQGSMAEICVAKNMYVETKSGWFSDRSICYLASGKPVLHQDTGLKHLYPTGEGLIVFSTLDEAAAGVEEIRRNYDRHSKAAREIAEEYFDSDKVLTRLLENLGVG